VSTVAKQRQEQNTKGGKSKHGKHKTFYLQSEGTNSTPVNQNHNP